MCVTCVTNYVWQYLLVVNCLIQSTNWKSVLDTLSGPFYQIMSSFVYFFVQTKNKPIAQFAMSNLNWHLCTYQRPSRGVDPGDIWGNSVGFADFWHQFLARDGGIGPLLHFRGKIHGERPTGFVTSPPSWKWKIRTSGTGYTCKYSPI